LEKEDKFLKEKEAIAKKAVEFINEGDTLLLDSGTTVFHLVKELKRFNKLTVVTNSLLFAQELQDRKGIDVIIIGGFLRKETLALVGPLAEQSLNKMKVDIAFIGTNGLDLVEGITLTNLVVDVKEALFILKFLSICFFSTIFGLKNKNTADTKAVFLFNSDHERRR